MNIMFNRIKSYFIISSSLLLMTTIGCKKGTFDINSVNPNSPSSVSPQFVLSEALVASAYATYGGNEDEINGYMGYTAFSGDYGGYGTEATYNLTTNDGSGNWDYVYNTVLVNYKFVEKASLTDPNQAYFLGIAKIMESYHFGRLVDLYNNIPYSQALQGGTINYPAYDDAKTVYTSCIHQLDSAIAIINAAPGSANSPGSYDVMFGGNMSEWIQFANTVKLKLLLNISKTADGAALIQSELGSLTAADFLGAGQDAAVNPGYSNSSSAQQNPQWADLGFTTAGAATGGHQFRRANSYAVNFYQSTNDPRDSFFYAFTTLGAIAGRPYGSLNGNDHNTNISAIGPGILQSPGQSAVLLPAFESLFMQADAIQEGFLTGGAEATYQTAVEESFRLLGVPSYKTAADNYVMGSSTKVNWANASDKLTLIITQEWAALNLYDPIQAWDNWRRLGIPADLPVSIYPGTVASHIPYRYLYPTSEFTSNSANVTAQGTISATSSKIFWMP